MKYAVLLALLGLSQIALALSNRLTGPVLWLLVWSGASWILAGMAYAFRAGWAFGKRPDGGMNRLNVLLFFPFLAVTWLLWHIQKVLTREPVHNEIAPGIWLGRRCYDAELPPGTETIVDLTCEFPEPPEVRRGRTYLCVPTLDASTPSQAAFQALMESISRSPTPVYIHCAQGHGRSAMVAAATLVAKGLAPSLEEAERAVKQARPAIRISAPQRRLLETWASNYLQNRLSAL